MFHADATEQPEMYEKDEYGRMLMAVRGIFSEAIALGSPYRAWIE